MSETTATTAATARVATLAGATRYAANRLDAAAVDLREVTYRCGHVHVATVHAAAAEHLGWARRRLECLNALAAEVRAEAERSDPFRGVHSAAALAEVAEQVATLAAIAARAVFAAERAAERLPASV